MADQETDNQPQEEQAEGVATAQEEAPQEDTNQSNEAPAPETVTEVAGEGIEETQGTNENVETAGENVEQAQDANENAATTEESPGDAPPQETEQTQDTSGSAETANENVEQAQDENENAATEESPGDAPPQEETQEAEQKSTDQNAETAVENVEQAQDANENAETAAENVEQAQDANENGAPPQESEQTAANDEEAPKETPGDTQVAEQAEDAEPPQDQNNNATTEEGATTEVAEVEEKTEAVEETTEEAAAEETQEAIEASEEQGAAAGEDSWPVGEPPNNDEEEQGPGQKQDEDVAQQEDREPSDEPAPDQPPSPTMVEHEVQEATQEDQKEALSPRRTGINLEATATVKFVLMPSGQVVTLANTLGQTLRELKNHFASELKMPPNLIMLMFDGKGMNEATTLADLGVGPNGTVQLEMQSADPVNNPLKAYRPRQEYHMPDVITVRVMTEDCEAKDVVVEIERSRCKKPFLGGFRNKNTGAEYHNASAQTMQKPRPPPTTERFCRDTQTCEQRNLRQQTTNTTSTQMTGVGVHISNAQDKLITPGKYFSADDHWAMILRNVIILQKYYRRWLAKRYVAKLKEDKAHRLEWERREELRKKKEKEERIKKDYARRINPKTKADFDMLIHCLEKWRQEEMERINSTLTGAERKAAMCMLLDQETELLAAIERHKNEANLDNKEKRIMAFLEQAAAPKKWQGHDGNLTFMDTPYTIRAKELRDIYNSINMKYLTQDERLDVLLTLKHTVKEHDCKLTQEIIELINREADLLMRGVKEGNLTGLRKRISTLFLQYIKTPTFNPEAAKLLKVPQDPATLRKNINYCHSCGSYLPSTEFFITSNSKNVGRCRRCQKIENDGRQREDHTYYKVMLKALRKSEEAMQDGSSISYLLQEHDLRYLVENIWSNQSILSAWNDLYDLVLVRWDKHQEWSPWNCILLTHDEAEAHKKLFNLEEGYGHIFIHKVTQKHNFARNYFSRLPGMAEVLRQKVGSRELDVKNGPTVAGHSVPTKSAQKV